jgi:hypothetical protein
LLNPRFVHERAVKSADLFLERGWIFIRFRAERFHHLVQPLFGQIGHCEPERVRRFIWRNLRFVDPDSVGVTEEIVAWSRRRIHSGQIKSPSAVFQSRRRWIFGVGERRRTAESGGQKNAEQWTHK